MLIVDYQTNAMGVTGTSWGPFVFREAQKYWGYAIATSILLSLYDLWMLKTAKGAGSGTKESKRELQGKDITQRRAPEISGAKYGQERGRILYQLLIDCCDITIPASFLDWISMDPVLVGIAMSTSSLMTMRTHWIRLNGMSKESVKQKKSKSNKAE